MSFLFLQIAKFWLDFRTNLLPSLEEHKRPSLPVLASANFDEHLPSSLRPK